MKEKILILAYPGVGKTYIADNYNNVSDFEFQHYRYDYGKFKDLPLEELKGRRDIRTPNPEYPNNFIEALQEELNKRAIVLVPLATSILKELSKLKEVRIILAIKDKEAFADLERIYKDRNNDEDFIKHRREDFEKFYNIVEESSYEKIILAKGQYLDQALKLKGIEMLPGRGYKNYK